MSKPKKGRKVDKNPLLNVFVDLYKKSVSVSTLPSTEQKADIDESLSQKRLPKNIQWYPIYADRPNSYQADLMFEPTTNSRGEHLLQAILCVININTKYAFAEPVDYKRNLTKQEERAWNDKKTTLPVNNKTPELVLRAFKRLLENMKYEAQVLHTFHEFDKPVKFHIDRLYMDDGGEFKGVFRQYCDTHNISVHIFRKDEGSKRRLAVVERFNKTMRLYLEKQRKVEGNRPLAELIPNILDLYNRHHNNRAVSTFFRKDLDKGTSWYRDEEDAPDKKDEEDKVRYFPAMMLFPGKEQEYIQYMKKKTQAVDKHYAKTIQKLVPGTRVRYFKRKEDKIFKKSRGSTLSEPHTVQAQHTYSYNHKGKERQRLGPSFTLDDTSQRYLPYEMDILPKNKKHRKK